MYFPDRKYNLKSKSKSKSKSKMYFRNFSLIQKLKKILCQKIFMIYNITIKKNTIKNQQQRKINNRRIRKKRKWDRLKEFRRVHSPAPQSLFQKKKRVEKWGRGRAGEMLCLSLIVLNPTNLIDPQVATS